MALQTNLPPANIQDSAEATKLFFDTYGEQPLEYLATEVDAAVAFFEGRGFASEAAVISAAILLKQAKLDAVPVFKLLDQLKSFSSTQINLLVGEILNNNRPPTSTLGFKTGNITKETQTRNIAA